jgi:hypothetical protein
VEHCSTASCDDYFQLSNEKECTVLREYIEAVAFNSGNSLRDQQLTNEGIPVIVDKSIRFVYSHGCLTEGETVLK